jgi:Fic family protein
MPYTPIFQTTPHLLKVLEEISALNERIKTAAIGVSWTPSLQKDAAARQVHGSTAIEGNPLTLAEVKILAEGGALPHAKPRAIQEVLNYFAALRFIEKHAEAKCGSAIICLRKLAKCRASWASSWNGSTVTVGHGPPS